MLMNITRHFRFVWKDRPIFFLLQTLNFVDEILTSQVIFSEKTILERIICLCCACFGHKHLRTLPLQVRHTEIQQYPKIIGLRVILFVSAKEWLSRSVVLLVVKLWATSGRNTCTCCKMGTRKQMHLIALIWSDTAVAECSLDTYL